ncbi:MAG: 4'-phosphopantetheinyl transferase family protein [Acidobacteriaceae bacterium]
MFYWLEQRLSDVPNDDTWLSCAEQEQANAMHVSKRRSDWRLGRWTAKLALASFYQLAAEPDILASIELRAAASGAPVLLYRGEMSSLSISLSHSNGNAFVVIAPPGNTIGCDLEKIEPRSAAFIEDYCTESELHLVDIVSSYERPLLVNLIWSAKESVLKLLGIGLRGDIRSISVVIDVQSLAMGVEQWLVFKARSSEAQTFYGMWRNSNAFVRTVAAEKPISRAVELTIPAVSRLQAKGTSTG